MIFLVDEAHNLVDRAREMYSAALYRRDFDNVYKKLKPLRPENCPKNPQMRPISPGLRGEPGDGRHSL